MDLATLKPVERIVEIVLPTTGENAGVRVNLLPMTDPKIEKVKRQIQNKSLALHSRGKSFNADDVAENEKDLLLAAVVGWEWYGADFHNEVPAFTPQKVAEVFQELPWFKAQIIEALDDEKAFFSV